MVKYCSQVLEYMSASHIAFLLMRIFTLDQDCDIIWNKKYKIDLMFLLIFFAENISFNVARLGFVS